MPRQFLSKKIRDKLNNFPDEISQTDLIVFFTLSLSDIKQIPIHTATYNRLGFALQLCSLRFLGFCPDNVIDAPRNIVRYLSNQLDVNPNELSKYGKREHTRTDHLQAIKQYLGFKKFSSEIQSSLLQWLSDRAMEHDKPSVLMQIVCDKLRTDKIIRPGITILESIVSRARQNAQDLTYNHIKPLLAGRKTLLDKMLQLDRKIGKTKLSWLRFGATSNTPGAILDAINKLTFLKEVKAEQIELNELSPNRIKFLAQIGRNATNQALKRAKPQRKYPILIAFLYQSLTDIIDEIVELFDRCLMETYSRAKNDLQALQLANSKAANEKVICLRDILQILTNKNITDSKVRDKIYADTPRDQLELILEECKILIRPKDDKAWDYLGNRYSYLRQFIPSFLAELEFCSNNKEDEVLEAICILKQLDKSKKRNLPDDAPQNFIPQSWRSYVFNKNDKLSRKYYEICTLWELRRALRSGDIWIKNSRKYADLETYLIPKSQWVKTKKEFCQMIGLNENGAIRLQEKAIELNHALSRFSKELKKGTKIKNEKGKLTFSRLKAIELPDSCKELQKIISERLPRVELSELLIEVDSWVQYTKYFEHLSKTEPKTEETLKHIYASIMSQACDFGFEQMAEISELSYNKLAWCSNWYIREKTLQNAINSLVNYHYSQPLSEVWGGGTMSSSDGQRFPVTVKSRNATSLPKYFGYGKGLTFYSWTSDQFSQYGSKVIVSTIRDASYVLDAILDNETELQILEHTTDTAGYTEIVFALFDLLGMQFSPRIRDMADQKIYCFDNNVIDKNIRPFVGGKIKPDIFLQYWDDLLRVVASIKMGWVSASLFIGKLQAYPVQNHLAKAFQEYGRLGKSIYVPTYLCSETKQRRVSMQLNKGEALHFLRQFLFFANRGEIRKSQPEDQANQASCLTLVTNAVIVWNTAYINKIVKQLTREGYSINKEDLEHISPCRFEHINKFGKYSFNVNTELNRKTLRPLR